MILCNQRTGRGGVCARARVCVCVCVCVRSLPAAGRRGAAAGVAHFPPSFACDGRVLLVRPAPCRTARCIVSQMLIAHVDITLRM